MGQIRMVEAKLRKPNIYAPVGLTLATYCQSDQSLFPKYLSYAWLPHGLAGLGHPYCSLGTNYAHVEMGGGFYHYGYRLQLDEAASTAATNAWQLSLYREGSPDTHLMTLAMASTQHLAANDLERMALSGFDDSIKRGNTDAYRGKVMLQLRFADTAEAARTCQAWMQRQPNSWLPHFTYAHVRCRQGQAGAAAAEFEDWVRQHKNFAHCIYLALFEFREGRTNEALQGVRLALEQPFIEPWGTDGNKFYLGQNGALIAYLQGDYGLSLAMCDKMLSDSRPEKWWTREVLRLKAAVVFMKGDQSRALELMQQAEANRERGPFSEEPKARADQALRAALQRKDTAFIQDFRNCVDEHDKWFSPFETDETGIHGGGLQVPSPYPRSWTTDEMNPEKEQ
jgi:tetratricopeptide (TPR) repeat protein